MVFCKKTCFSSEKQAMLHVERIKKKSKRDKIPKRAYFCKKCNTWHLTSKDKILTPFEKLKKENLDIKNELVEKEKLFNSTIVLINKIEKTIKKRDSTIYCQENRIKKLELELEELNQQLRYL